MEIIDGGICAVDDVKAYGASDGKYGAAVILCRDSHAAAVFTSNKVVAAPIIISKKNIENGKLSAIVANSGNANCFTGEKGLDDAKNMINLVAQKIHVNPDDVAVGSTGVIGRKMPMQKINKLIEKCLENLENSKEASKKAAEAIMTTDKHPKQIAVKTLLKNGISVKIGGIVKGSGMIEPNMGTMLCYLTTDVKASPSQLQAALKKAVDVSFNMLVIDGDESTNDMVVLMANGKSGEIDQNFQDALEFVCKELAKMMAKDGEGATKYMEVRVKGAYTVEDARKAAKAVAKSSLVKTALFGADPNWGRIVAAVGYSGADMDEKLISVALESEDKLIGIVEKGEVKAYQGSDELEKAEDIMKNREINIIIDLGMGVHTAVAYGCDLSYDYIKINAEYTT
ncbi:MAG: bifunctional ornithine acetyltransferase/N-acetylglutamate synthase [Methanobacteriaceae archaeon]|nr:bifunctional ornithine acetyltransferase/N-acetylglutamate synthase [Methanobacteriaceae archaeon]